MPLASRSSTRLCWAAAVPSDGILNSTSMFGRSLAAFSVPLRAITQNGDALLVTKASLCLVPALPGPLAPPVEVLGWQLANKSVIRRVQTKAQISRRNCFGRIGFLET